MKAPDKIYVSPYEIDYLALGHRLDHPIYIEYTRTDAFIEKAEKYIRNVADGLDRDDDVEAFISGFIKYMKEK